MVALSQSQESLNYKHLPYVTLSLASNRLNKYPDSYEVYLVEVILLLQLSII